MPLQRAQYTCGQPQLIRKAPAQRRAGMLSERAPPACSKLVSSVMTIRKSKLTKLPFCRGHPECQENKVKSKPTHTKRSHFLGSRQNIASNPRSWTCLFTARHKRDLQQRQTYTLKKHRDHPSACSCSGQTPSESQTKGSTQERRAHCMLREAVLALLSLGGPWGQQSGGVCVPEEC